MIARRVFPRQLQGERYFRWRGGDVSRVEALSDMVFAFALTLIVVSLEVPTTFAELKHAFLELPVFAACFAILVMCWHYNYRFHRRYGLEDFGTEVLNAVLLFLILLYVYPLKFLFSLLWDMILRRPLVVRTAAGVPVLGSDGQPLPIVEGGDMGQLLLLYSAGYAGIFLVFALMNHRAWRRREELELAPVEVVMTRATTGSHLLSAAFGLVSVAIVAVSAALSPLAGMIYILVGPAQGIYWWRQSRTIDRLGPPPA